MSGSRSWDGRYFEPQTYNEVDNTTILSDRVGRGWGGGGGGGEYLALSGSGSWNRWHLEPQTYSEGRKLLYDTID